MRSMNVLPGIRGDADDEPVRDDLRAAGDGGAVTAGFADDRGGFASDGAFIDTGDAFDDFTVGRDEVVGFHQNQVTGCAVRVAATWFDRARGLSG